ncbi:MAG: KTSC domain-containing protein [Ancalomicrobiaceae bacterium]|nr:KTSC domain-containing protein [Ancalomicrobiaceae bacterium]
MPSTAIRQFSYDEESHTLFVTFIDGDLYAYLDVEPQIYADMQRAPSKGRFFAYRVRNRYGHRKLTDD